LLLHERNDAGRCQRYDECCIYDDDLVHAENGTRIGCGVIELVRYDDDTMNLLTTNTVSLIETDVVSQVTVYEVNMGVVCYFGSAINLEPDLLSYLSTDDVVGTNCSFTNGCGVHIHNGTSCLDRNSQGGHFYNVSEDPWLFTMYPSTDANGNAYFTGCVETGVTEGSFVDRAFIVHSDNGTRVSCGLLTTNTTATDNSPPRPAPSSAPNTSPSKEPSFAPSFEPSAKPNATPSYEPSKEPSQRPSSAPNTLPSKGPSQQPPTRSNNDSTAASMTTQRVLPMLFYSWMMAAVVTVAATTIL
jgi:hypothetical protein